MSAKITINHKVYFFIVHEYTANLIDFHGLKLLNLCETPSLLREHPCNHKTRGKNNNKLDIGVFYFTRRVLSEFMINLLTCHAW